MGGESFCTIPIIPCENGVPFGGKNFTELAVHSSDFLLNVGLEVAIQKIAYSMHGTIPT